MATLSTELNSLLGDQMAQARPQLAARAHPAQRSREHDTAQSTQTDGDADRRSPNEPRNEAASATARVRSVRSTYVQDSDSAFRLAASEHHGDASGNSQNWVLSLGWYVSELRWAYLSLRLRLRLSARQHGCRLLTRRHLCLVLARRLVWIRARFRNAVIDLAEDEREVAVKLGDRAHLELGAVAEREYDVTRRTSIPAQPLDVGDLAPQHLHHVLALKARGHLNPPVGELVARPRLARQRGGEGNDAHHGEERQAGDQRLRRRGRPLKKCLLWGKDRGWCRPLDLLLRLLGFLRPRL